MIRCELTDKQVALLQEVIRRAVADCPEPVVQDAKHLTHGGQPILVRDAETGQIVPVSVVDAE